MNDFIHLQPYRGIAFRPLKAEWSWYECEQCDDTWHTEVYVDNINYENLFYEWIDDVTESSDVMESIRCHVKNLVDEKSPLLEKIRLSIDNERIIQRSI